MSTSTVPRSAKRAASEKPAQPLQQERTHSLVYQQRCSDIWMLLLSIRFVNALCVHTFFQPDEYFQSLEPAWQMAFGSQSGAWITWVCNASPEVLPPLTLDRNGSISSALPYIPHYLRLFILQQTGLWKL